MKIDKTTYREKEENQIGMTATTPANPIKFYFLPTNFFYFLRADPHCTHWLVARANKQTKTCQRVQFCRHILRNLLE